MTKRLVIMQLFLMSLIACGGSASATLETDRPMITTAESTVVDKPTSKTLIIDSSKAVCQGAFQQVCLKVREPSAAEFGFLYDPIEGLDYQWGHHYRVEIEQQNLSRPPQDRSSVQRHLTSVTQTAEDAIGRQYVYDTVPVTDRTFTVNDGIYHFLEHPFRCSKPQCSALINDAQNARFVQLIFAYIGGGEIELIEWREVEAP